MESPVFLYIKLNEMLIYLSISLYTILIESHIKLSHLKGNSCVLQQNGVAGFSTGLAMCIECQQNNSDRDRLEQ